MRQTKDLSYASRRLTVSNMSDDRVSHISRRKLPRYPQVINSQASSQRRIVLMKTQWHLKANVGAILKVLLVVYHNGVCIFVI